MSTLLIIPIVAGAIFMIYRHMRGAWAGSGACHSCPSQGACGMGMDPKNARHTAPETPHTA